MRTDTPDRVRIWLEIAERVEGRARPAPWLNDVEGPFDPRPSTFAPPRITARTPQDDDAARLVVMLRNAATPLLESLAILAALREQGGEGDGPGWWTDVFDFIGGEDLARRIDAVLGAVAGLTQDTRP